MKLIYTVCTANYLYQALTLGDSLKETNPDYELIICLTDEIPDTSVEIPYRIIPISTLNLPYLQEFSDKYTVIELACACKPIFGLHLLETYPTLEKLIYFDTDICVYQPLTQIEKNLDEYDILLTPHITKAIPLAEKWNEKQYLNAGLYNAGFVAFKRTENTMKFLTWWKTHLKEYGYYDFCRGMGVDQLCLNFAPIFFEKVLVDYNPAHNIAYWNLRERTLTYKNHQYVVNDHHPLTFFHFSGYSPDRPTLISKHFSLAQQNTQPALKQIFEAYHQALIRNHYAYFKGLIPTYGKFSPPPKQKNFVVKFIEKSAWKVINFIEHYEVKS